MGPLRAAGEAWKGGLQGRTSPYPFLGQCPPGPILRQIHADSILFYRTNDIEVATYIAVYHTLLYHANSRYAILQNDFPTNSMTCHDSYFPKHAKTTSNLKIPATSTFHNHYDETKHLSQQYNFSFSNSIVFSFSCFLGVWRATSNSTQV